VSPEVGDELVSPSLDGCRALAEPSLEGCRALAEGCRALANPSLELRVELLDCPHDLHDSLAKVSLDYRHALIYLLRDESRDDAG